MAEFQESAVVCPCTDEKQFRDLDSFSGARSVLKTLHSVKSILNEEQCRSVGEAGYWWDDELAVILATKPPSVLQEALGVLEGYKEQRWCGIAAERIKILSELFQERLVTEDEVKRMKRGDLPERLVIVQCIKPPEVATRTADVLDKFGHNKSAIQLRALNELFTRHLLTAEECSEVAGKGRWEDHLALVLSTNPAEVVPEACEVLEKLGCHVKKLKTLNELFTRHLLTAEECSEVARKELWEWDDHFAQVLSTKPAEVVQEPCQVLEKHGNCVKKLKTLNELYTRHLLTAEECSEVARKGWRWEDHLAQVLSTKPAEVVQEACQVLEKHGCPVKELKTLNELFTRHLLTAEECSEVARKGRWEWESYLAQVLSTKPAEVWQETIEVLEKHGCHVKKLKTLHELFTRRLLTAEECSEVARKGRWEWESHLAHVLSTKSTEVWLEACQVLEKHGCPVKKELKTLNELFTRRLITAEECSEVARKGRRGHILFLNEEWQERSEEWEDDLALVLLTKPAEVVQEACQVLEKHGCDVKKLKILNELFTRHLLTAEECSEVARKEWENHLALVLSTKPAEIWQEACEVLEKHGCPVKKELKTLNELFTRHLLTAEECSEVARKGRWEWEDHLAEVLSTKPAEVVQEAVEVLEKHGCPVKKELKMLSKLYQEKLVTEDEVERMEGEERYLAYRLVQVQCTKPPQVVARTADLLDKWGFNVEASILRGMSRRPRGVGSDPRHGGSMFSADLRYRGSSTAATSTHSTSHPVKRYQEMTMHPHDEEPSLSQKGLSSEQVEEVATSQGSKVLSQPAGGGSDPPKEPDTAAMKAAEADLDDHCWIPFDFQFQSVGPEGGKLCLQPSAGALGGEEGETIFLEVPPGAVSPSESVEVLSAVIPDGPFTLPEGYQLGSMAVYIHYDSRHVTQPLKLRLPHWYGGEDHIQDGLSFAMAPHTLKEREHFYHFELLEGGRWLSSHCGELEIDGHCSQFVVVFRKGAVSRYQAISLQKQERDETRCHVAVTYAFPLWRAILTKYRNGWTVDIPSCSFTFGKDGKLKGKLEKEIGNGWQAGINGSCDLLPYDVDYSSHGITNPKLLKKAVRNMDYPPAISCVITYREELRKTGRPVLVRLDLLGADAGTELTFQCQAYEEVDCQQLNGSRNAAAAASQSPLTPPPDMVATTPPHTVAATPSSVVPVSGEGTSITPAPTPPAPDTAAIIEALSHQLDAKWRHFGTFLGVDYQLMEAIKTGNGSNTEDCMLDLLGKWTSNQAGTGTLPRTWKVVVDAVKETGFGVIAESLAVKHGVNLPQ